ncbi:type IV pilin protein [Litoribacillus peritrichatus]|uniref:Type IV pilin protein n=1 Tax=Litoribacillus peritrichatus TaxID=718191 RepID=A0ABP7NB61_9GAMM
MTSQFKKQKGFSLIELMIAIAIIGVLGFVAYPQYQLFLQQGNRADALEQLTALELEMRQYYFENTTYKGLASGGGDTGTPSSTLLMELDDSITNLYTITISAADKHSFQLKAVPKNSQSSDICGTITIGLNGTLEYSPPGGGTAPGACKQ